MSEYDSLKETNHLVSRIGNLFLIGIGSFWLLYLEKLQ